MVSHRNVNSADSAHLFWRWIGNLWQLQRWTHKSQHLHSLHCLHIPCTQLKLRDENPDDMRDN